jgi:hypothetical protein
MMRQMARFGSSKAPSMIADARERGLDEADVVELIVLDEPHERLRQNARLLKKLGYTVVADRVREMAKQRKRTKPELPGADAINMRVRAC